MNICQSVQRMRLSHRGFVMQDANEPLFYRDAKWSTECVIEIFDIPAGTTVQALSLAMIRAGGVEIFKDNQRLSFSHFSYAKQQTSKRRDAAHPAAA